MAKKEMTKQVAMVVSENSEYNGQLAKEIFKVHYEHIMETAPDDMTMGEIRDLARARTRSNMRSGAYRAALMTVRDTAVFEISKVDANSPEYAVHVQYYNLVEEKLKELEAQ